MVKEMHEIKDPRPRSSLGPNSQSERPDFAQGPITVEIRPATLVRIENPPLEVAKSRAVKGPTCNTIIIKFS